MFDAVCGLFSSYSLEIETVSAGTGGPRRQETLARRNCNSRVIV